jgi:hypothetical protein
MLLNSVRRSDRKQRPREAVTDWRQRRSLTIRALPWQQQANVLLETLFLLILFIYLAFTFVLCSNAELLHKE